MGTSEAVDIDLVARRPRGAGRRTLLIDAGCVYDARTALRRARRVRGVRARVVRGAAARGRHRRLRLAPRPLADPDRGRRGGVRPRVVPPARSTGGRSTSIRSICRAAGSRTPRTSAPASRRSAARLCNHCYTSPITVAASIHWLSTCRDAFVFEDCVEDSPLRHELTHREGAVRGRLDGVPDRPGLGVTLNEDFVRAHLVAESR